ncbi:MAG: sialate O-acetylesterase, partial [Paludibacteraceae bacterium]|nr:sialate O-acetylesterase [Paludibacteraceae bacterium]
MKNKIIIFFIGVLFTLRSVVSFAAPDPNFHIYLCFGQSNMEGQGRIESKDLVVSDRFQMMSTQNCGSRELYKWYTAVPPLAGCYKQLGPADYFGRTMLENSSPEVKIGVVVVAVGGCDIKLFDKDNYLSYSYNVEDYMKEIIRAYGGNPYGRFIDCAKKAQEVGVIKGILLHQGETNTGDYSWPSKVKGVYENILNDLNLDGKDVPLLVGEVVRTEQGGSCGRHNDVIAKVPSTIPNSYVISAEG